MIFVDSNVPMYLIGADEDMKTRARASIEVVVRAHTSLVTSAEVLQEILHRYHAVRRHDAVVPAFDALLGLVDTVFSVTMEDALRAKEIMLAHRHLSARDAIHVAVMQGHDVSRILSFDRGFDSVDTIERITS